MDKSLYLKGIEGIVEGDFFVWMLGRCTRERVRVEGVLGVGCLCVCVCVF